MTPAEAVQVIRSHIDGLPDHPWIPGVNFADGQVMEALDVLERAHAD